MPKSRSRIKRDVKYDDKHEHEISTLSQRRLVADAYWRTQNTGDTVNLWRWYIKDNGPFTIENFKKVASKDLDLDCVDEDGQLLYPSISRIQPEPLFDIICNSSNPAWVPRQPTNKHQSKIDILKLKFSEAFVPSTERLSKPKTAKRKYQPKKHPSRSRVPLEILPEEPVEKIRHIVRRNRGPNRRYMDSVSKKQ
ncbi:unnamed protein product [Owenia fusiformis]|uniref:Uncharacterized protein n=1 Tax=Owenia fusiformis TaxID=6347 RepID=A0A8S4Q3J6_OWEFU|nr:unnamed protein product [Owenia fusiformis]